MTEEQTDDQTRDEPATDKPNQGETTEGAKQGDNPGVDEISGTGAEGDDQGGLGDRTGGAGGGDATEEGDHNKGQLRK